MSPNACRFDTRASEPLSPAEVGPTKKKICVFHPSTELGSHTCAVYSKGVDSPFPRDTLSAMWTFLQRTFISSAAQTREQQTPLNIVPCPPAPSCLPGRPLASSCLQRPVPLEALPFPHGLGTLTGVFQTLEVLDRSTSFCGSCTHFLTPRAHTPRGRLEV